MSAVTWTFEDQCYETPGGSGGGATGPTRPAVGALDILAYYGGGTANQGAAGTLALTATANAKAYTEIDPWGGGFWIPSSAATVASANTVKGEETGAFTLWAFVVVPTAPSLGILYPIVFKQDVAGFYAGHQIEVYLLLNDAQQIRGGVYANGAHSAATASTTISLRTVHLVALTYDPAVGLDIFLDGVNVGSDHVHTGAVEWTGGPWGMLGEADTPMNSLVWVSEWRLHRGALSASDLLAIYQAWVTP